MLSAKRFRLEAKDRRNRKVAFYISMEVKGVFHFTVGSGSDQIDAYINATDLADAVIQLTTGRKFGEARHAAKNSERSA